MIKLVTFVIAFILSIITAYSQSIKGTVFDKETNESIPYATIILKDAKNQFLEGVTTNDNGDYVLNYNEGEYKIEVSFIGYRTHSSLIKIDKESLLNINLDRETTTLDEVVVTAEETTVKQLIDKKVIHVGKDLLSSGGDATTVLNQLSEVQADENGNISLKGNSNVNVLINGKPSPLSTSEVLQQISADDINKIEIITSPSAKYQANGLTGIVNIITKKKVKKGISINSTTNINSLEGHGIQSNLTYGRSKTNYKFGVSYANNIYKNENTQKRTGSQPYDQVNDFEFNGKVYKINSGIDWFPNDSNEFSIGVDYTDNGHSLDNVSIINQNETETNQSTYATHSHRTFNTNGNYRYKFKNEEDFLELDIQLSNNTNVLKSDFRPNLGVLDNATDNDVFIVNTAIDYSGTINEKLKIEVGTLLNRQKLDNSRKFIEENGEIGSKEQFENIQSTYALYSLIKYNLDKLKVQLGVRGELFNRKANLLTNNLNIENEYANLFPSVHFGYDLSDNQTLSLGYNRRTSRPTLSQVNPIAFQSREFSIFQGNPELEPEFSSNFEFSYQYKISKFSISPSISYRLTEDVITRNNVLGDNGVNQYISINSGATDAYGIELSTNVKPYKWLNSNLSFNWNYEEFRDGQNNFTRNYSRNAYITFRNQFVISKNTRVVLSMRYNAERTSYFGINEDSGQIDIGIRQKVLKDKGSINFRIADIFDTQQYQGINTGIGFVQTYRYKPVTRVAHLSFSYRIDGGKVKQRNKKSREYKSGVID